MVLEDFINELALMIIDRKTDAITRVAVNGVDGSGKSKMADALTANLLERGEHVIRGSIDDFHNERTMRYARGRYSPEGFYRDSFDIDALAKMFLGPLGPDGSRNYRSACFDYKKDKRVELEEKSARDGDILVFDGVFLFTPKLLPHWDVKIFLEVPFYETFRRMNTRDGLDLDEYADSNRRYRQGQQLYLDECCPVDIADIVIDNLDFERPSLKRH